jgi:two-component system response regulator MprA
MSCVLVVDDDNDIRGLVRELLERSGYDVLEAPDGNEGLRVFYAEQPDLVILDVSMPGLDGWGVLERIRELSDVPVVMLTARAEELDKVRGLRAGADDYVTKPFALEELLARVRALLRRAADAEGAEVLTFADVELDLGTREVRRAGRVIDLTRTEFALLELFLRNPRQVLTRSIIFERVWGYDFGFASNSLDVYIGYLRRKTEAGGEPRLIHTVRGVGYALREQ